MDGGAGARRPVGVHERQPRDDVGVGRLVPVLRHGVVLRGGHERERVARAEPGPLEEPAVRVRDHEREPLDEPGLVHRADERVLGAADVRIAEAPGAPGAGDRVRSRIPGGRLPARDHARGAAGAGRLVADLPVDRVRAEEQERRPGVAGRLDRVARLPGPVLVVPDRHERARAREPGRARRDVDVRRVRHVVAGALEEPREGELVAAHEPEPALRPVRPIERDARSEPPRQLPGRVRVERLAAPRVVRLPRVHGRLDDEVGSPIVDDDERREHRPAVVAHELHAEVAGDEVPRERDAKRGGPGAAHHPGSGLDRARRLRPDGARTALRHATRAGAPVPAEPVQDPAHLVAAVGRGLHLDRVSGARGHAIQVRLQRPARIRPHAPGRLARERVLGGDRARAAPVRRAPARAGAGGEQQGDGRASSDAHAASPHGPTGCQARTQSTCMRVWLACRVPNPPGGMEPAHVPSSTSHVT